MSEKGEFQVLLKPAMITVKKIHGGRLVNRQYSQLISGTHCSVRGDLKTSLSLALGQGLFRSTECFCSKTPFYEYDLNGYASFVDTDSAPLGLKPT